MSSQSIISTQNITYLSTNILVGARYKYVKDGLKKLIKAIRDNTYPFKSSDEKNELQSILRNLNHNLNQHSTRFKLQNHSEFNSKPDFKQTMQNFYKAIVINIDKLLDVLHKDKYKNNSLYVQFLILKGFLDENEYQLFDDVFRKAVEQNDPEYKEYFDAMIDLIDYVMVNEEKSNDVSDELQQIKSILARLKDDEPSIIEEEEQEYEDAHDIVNDFTLSKSPQMDKNNLTFAGFDSDDDDDAFRQNLNETFTNYLHNMDEPPHEEMNKTLDFFKDLQPEAVKQRKKVAKEAYLDEEGENNIIKELERANNTKKGTVKGQRENRTMETIKEKLKRFKNLNISGTHDTTFYKRNFLDIIINGNFRVKYIAAAAKRDTAERYSRTHLDEDGKPKYRLLPKNAIDPNNKAITDLNGDKVDDVVLVDKKGVPVIVNGYKLVYASPYKKVWLTLHPSKEERLNEPFNVWINKMFQKSVDNVNWETGKYEVAPIEEMKPYIDHYTSIGLGKPRVSERLTPNMYWVSLFSKVWNLYWMCFEAELPLKRVINMISLANAIYVQTIDVPIKSHMEGSKVMKYPAWVAYRRLYKDDYKKLALRYLQNALSYIEPVIDVKTNQIKEQDSKQWNQEFQYLLHQIHNIIHKFYIIANDMKAVINFCKTASNADVRAQKEAFQKNIDHYVELLYGEGSEYRLYKANQKAARVAKQQKASDFDVEDGYRSGDSDNDPQE